MRLKHYARVEVGLEGADFWLRRRGTKSGEPTDTYSKYDIGIQVVSQAILPRYLYYWFMYAHSQNLLPKYGSLFDHVRVEDVKNIEVIRQ